MVFTWEMAEELAAAHMRELGFFDARRTGPGTDGGIDVTAQGAVAQVKHLSVPVGSPDIQRFRGAAHGIEDALFYSSSGYTTAAVVAADRAKIALFQFTTANEVQPVNSHAQNSGFGPLLLGIANDLGPETFGRMTERFHEDNKLFEVAWACTRALEELQRDLEAGTATPWPGWQADLARIEEEYIPPAQERNAARARLAELYDFDGYHALAVEHLETTFAFVASCGFDQDAFNLKIRRELARIRLEM